MVGRVSMRRWRQAQEFRQSEHFRSRGGSRREGASMPSKLCLSLSALAGPPSLCFLACAACASHSRSIRKELQMHMHPCSPCHGFVGGSISYRNRCMGCGPGGYTDITEFARDLIRKRINVKTPRKQSKDVRNRTSDGAYAFSCVEPRRLAAPPRLLTSSVLRCWGLRASSGHKTIG